MNPDHIAALRADAGAASLMMQLVLAAIALALLASWAEGNRAREAEFRRLRESAGIVSAGDEEQENTNAAPAKEAASRPAHEARADRTMKQNDTEN